MRLARLARHRALTPVAALGPGTRLGPRVVRLAAGAYALLHAGHETPVVASVAWAADDTWAVRLWDTHAAPVEPGEPLPPPELRGLRWPSSLVYGTCLSEGGAPPGQRTVSFDTRDGSRIAHHLRRDGTVVSFEAANPRPDDRAVGIEVRLRARRFLGR